MNPRYVFKEFTYSLDMGYGGKGSISDFSLSIREVVKPFSKMEQTTLEGERKDRINNSLKFEM